MTDRFTRKERSQIMSRIHGTDTEPEKIVRSLLHCMGYRFRLHVRGLPGNPDIVLPGRKKIIFVHGCFWHGHKGCRRSGRPATHKEFWDRKIDGNIARDARIKRQLRSLGWDVFVVWQCRLRRMQRLQEKIKEFVDGQKKGKRRKRAR